MKEEKEEGRIRIKTHVRPRVEKRGRPYAFKVHAARFSVTKQRKNAGGEGKGLFPGAYNDHNRKVEESYPQNRVTFVRCCAGWFQPPRLGDPRDLGEIERE